jgi:hypothetical protein
MIQLEFSPADIERLHYKRFHHPHPRVQQRAEAVYLKALGYAHQDVCRIVRISPKTLLPLLASIPKRRLAELEQLNFRRPASELALHQATLEAAFKPTCPGPSTRRSTGLNNGPASGAVPPECGSFSKAWA